MGNAPSKIPLKFGADPRMLIQGDIWVQLELQQIFSRRICRRIVWSRALIQRQDGAEGREATGWWWWWGGVVSGTAGKHVLALAFAGSQSQHCDGDDAEAKTQSAQ